MALIDEIYCQRYTLPMPIRRALSFSPDTGQAILDFIRSHYMDDISIEDLLAIAGANAKKVQGIVRHLTGQSVHQYHQDYRLKKAIEDLQNPDSLDQKIITIAKRHGYSDDKYFFRVFRKKMGRTPDEYRAEIAATQLRG